MDYNTIPFTNISNKTFVGKYDGQEFIVEKEDLRYFPSFLSEHFAKQLMKEIINNMVRDKRKIDRAMIEEELNGRILGKEMKTLSIKQSLDMVGKVAKHEKQVQEMFENKKRDLKSKKIEALKIANVSRIQK